MNNPNFKWLEDLRKEKLKPSLMERLNKNWGIRADCLECYAEARIFDPSSSWECYLLAIDPNDIDQCAVIIVDEWHNIWTIQTTLYYLLGRYNENGELMEWDTTFVRRHAGELLKILQKRNP